MTILYNFHVQIPQITGFIGFLLNDYDNDGNLDIYNRMLDNRPFHRWEWNGSKVS